MRRSTRPVPSLVHRPLFFPRHAFTHISTSSPWPSTIHLSAASIIHLPVFIYSSSRYKASPSHAPLASCPTYRHIPTGHPSSLSPLSHATATVTFTLAHATPLNANSIAVSFAMSSRLVKASHSILLLLSYPTILLICTYSPVLTFCNLYIGSSIIFQLILLF